MIHGINGAQEGIKDDFKMKLDCVFYPLNDSISWLTTCMEEMKKYIATMQTHCVTEATTSASIDGNIQPSIDGQHPPSNITEFEPTTYTKADVDQLVDEI